MEQKKSTKASKRPKEGKPESVGAGGYPTEWFIKEIDEDLVCPICGKVARDAVETDCAHVFCQDCISTWIDTKKTCPMDQEKLTASQLHPCRALRVKILNLRVRCPNDGCKQEMDLRSLETHTKEQCNRRQTKCAVCSACVTQDQLADHMKNSLAEHVQAVAERAAQERCTVERHGLQTLWLLERHLERETMPVSRVSARLSELAEDVAVWDDSKQKEEAMSRIDALKKNIDKVKPVFTCEHKADFDDQGLFQQLGTNRGTEPYKNPATRGCVVVTSSHNEGNPEIILNKTAGYEGICNNGPACIWFQIELRQGSFAPTGVCVAWANYCHQLNNFVLEAKEDKDAQFRPIMQVNTPVSGTAYFPIADQGPFKIFRFRQTGPDHTGRCFCFHLGAVELYGKHYEF